MAKPTLSVVIPAYNEELYIPRTLESLKKQTDTDFKLLVVDNNSHDKTVSIAKSYGARVVTEHKQGYVYALNTGMEASNTDITAVIDADTIADSHWVEVIKKTFTNSHVVAITGTAKLYPPSLLHTFISFLYFVFLKITFSLGKPNITGFNCAVRTSVFKQAGGLDPAYTMSPDIDLGLRLKKYGKVLFVSDMTTITSPRRWNDGVASTFIEYIKGYICTVWLRIPPPVKQKVIR